MLFNLIPNGKYINTEPLNKTGGFIQRHPVNHAIIRTSTFNVMWTIFELAHQLPPQRQNSFLW